MAPIVVLLNPSSGGGSAATVKDELAEQFRRAGAAVRVLLPGPGTDLTGMASQAAAEGCAALVGAGGDGTINAVASAAIRHDLPFGVVPLGTLNHFAKDAGVPLKMEEAVAAIVAGRTVAVDVAEVNGRFFLNNSSIGVYPRIVRLRERIQRRGAGKWLAAIWASLAVLRRSPFLAVRMVVHGRAEVRRTAFVFVGNNEYEMEGPHAGSRATVTGGRLGVYVMSATGRRSLVRLGLRVLLRRAERTDELERLVLTELTIETRRPTMQVALDGEVVDLETPLVYRALPGRLRLFLPARTGE